MPLLFESRRMSTMPKKIDGELKARAVRLVNDHQGEYESLTAAAAVVARQLGVGKESVRRWVIQSQVDEGQRPGASSEELAEIKTLKPRSADSRRTTRCSRRRRFSSPQCHPGGQQQLDQRRVSQVAFESGRHLLRRLRRAGSAWW